jgi:hypothetical protein
VDTIAAANPNAHGVNLAEYLMKAEPKDDGQAGAGRLWLKGLTATTRSATTTAIITATKSLASLSHTEDF